MQAVLNLIRFDSVGSVDYLAEMILILLSIMVKQSGLLL